MLITGVTRANSGMLLVAAAGVLYAASRLAVHAFARADGTDPGRRAIGQSLPIATTVLAAICLRMPEVAVAVIFATSVAFLSLVLGLAVYLRPMEAVPQERRIWAFVLPAGLLPLMAGFSAHLTWVHALMLLALGAVILPLWPAAEPVSEPAPTNPKSASSSGGESAVMGFLAAALAVGGAVLAMWAVRATGRHSQFASPGVLAATILSPLLVLPTLGTASSLAQRHRTSQALTALVGSVLLNICLLLPISIICWYCVTAFTSGEALSHVVQLFREHSRALPYAMASWRVETSILVVLGFLLVPVSMGRWMLGRIEAVLLVLGYALYLVLLAMFSLQQFIS